MGEIIMILMGITIASIFVYIAWDVTHFKR